MNKQQRSFVKGAAILGSLGIISKVFGAVYTILCTNILHAEGMAPYMAAFPVYIFLLAISSAGLPVAISKMVAERIALHDYRAAHRVFQKALKSMIFIGLATTVVMMIFAQQIANALGRPDAYLTMLCIAPSLFFVAIMSSYRGYFQGMMRMTPTAVSQVIEQVVKLIVGMGLAYLWVRQSPELGAAGAILGITVSEVIAFVYMLLVYVARREKIKLNLLRSRRTRLRHNIGSRMFYLALPIIVGACAMPIVQMADTAIINNTLSSMKSIIIFGKEVLINEDVVKSLFGLTGYVNPIVNLPAILSMALAMSLVPSISASHAEEDYTGVSNKSAIGLKLSMLVGLPCAIGLYMLSTPILNLLFKSSLQAGSNLPDLHLLATAGGLLAIMGVGVFFLTILQTMTGILQGLGKTYIPVVNLFIGVAVKIGISLTLIRMPEVNIQGAFFGTVACYGVAAILDIAFMIKHAKARLKFMDNFLKPLLAAGGMGAALHFAMPEIPLADYSRLLTIALVALAAVVYLILIFVFGALTKEDMEYIPGGGRVSTLMYRLGLWKR
jgi:stage V sporulation protein B